MSSGENVILVYIEVTDGQLNPASNEALRAGQLIAAATGQAVEAVVFGYGVEAVAAQVATKGVRAVHLVSDERLAQYTADGVTRAFQQVIGLTQPALIVMSHTYQVRDFAPKLAASLGRALIGDCVNFHLEEGQLVLTRQIFQGKLVADVAPTGERPWFVSFQIGAFRGDECAAGTASVGTLAVEIGADDVRQRPAERFREARAAVDLSQAPLIVAVGRGVREEKNIAIVRQLSEALGAELAASRPICDNDWLPMDRQIGSSGQTVAPKLYLAVGISGAIQHLVGMKGARTIVAINRDREAPIFEIADYGIVGDLFEIVPAITEAAKK